MALLRARNLFLSYGSLPLLEGIELDLEPGERVALVGRNGTGKSSLLRLLAGDEAPDSGEIWRPESVAIGILPQEIPRALEGPVFEIVAQALGPLGELLERYHAASATTASGAEGASLARLSELEHEIEARGAWQVQRRVNEVLTRLELDGDASFEGLSGGLKRRVLLARALANQPSVLLLDEPTNHLDIATIEWLERFLERDGRALLFVTHDRAFMARLATRILELDRGKLTSYSGGYSRFLETRAAALEAEERAAAVFDRKLQKEEVWVRQGIKARRTRNEGRVKELERMRAEQRARRKQVGNVRFELKESRRSGELVAEARGVAFGYSDAAPVIMDLDVTVLRGDRVGLIGPNGSGKTTLLKLLLGELEPVRGSMRLGTQLSIAYFDQTRAVLDEEKSIIENVGEGHDELEIAGRRRHIVGYLQDFLFSPERGRTPVKALSGGERNRVLLAKLFARPANLLVMDEPTNDLDIETLELLEELLLDYRGTLLLVSHDRAFLDHVVTSTLVIEEGGRVTEYAGGYGDWLEQRPQPAPSDEPTARPAPTTARPKPMRERRLTFKEKQELAALPARIQALETERESLFGRFSEPGFHRHAATETGTVKARLVSVEAELESAYARWQELDAIPA